MISINSTNSYNTDKHTIYVLNSPVECNRSYKSLIDKIGSKINLNGKVREITGVILGKPYLLIGDKLEITVSAPTDSV